MQDRPGRRSHPPRLVQHAPLFLQTARNAKTRDSLAGHSFEHVTGASGCRGCISEDSGCGHNVDAASCRIPAAAAARIDRDIAIRPIMSRMPMPHQRQAGGEDMPKRESPVWPLPPSPLQKQRSSPRAAAQQPTPQAPAGLTARYNGLGICELTFPSGLSAIALITELTSVRDRITLRSWFCVKSGPFSAQGSDRMKKQVDRRAFLKTSSQAGAGMLLAAAAQAAEEQPQPSAPPQDAVKPVRIGLVGYGKRGHSLINTLLALGPEVDIKAVCDVVPSALRRHRACSRAGASQPAGYRRGKKISGGCASRKTSIL